jgi:cysteine-rich repeat protein
MVGLVLTSAAPAQGQCGNGVIEPTRGEECDFDPEMVAIFGSRTCATEFGVSCGSLVCSPPEDPWPCLIDRWYSCGAGVCGDGCLGGREECDDGTENSDVDPDACRTDCRIARCGDGAVDTGEECDDGPRNSDYMPDACRSDCAAPVCGDGVIDVGQGEQCDLGPSNSDAPGSACTTHCIAPRCGNGTLEGGETCDDGNRVETDSCTNACVPNVCGDGLVNRTRIGLLLLPIEACDDGNNDDGDECRYDCEQDLTTCGNGVVNRGEECDEGASNSDEPDAGCRTDCRARRCGDGVVDPGAAPAEECDGGPECLPDCTRP